VRAELDQMLGVLRAMRRQGVAVPLPLPAGSPGNGR